MTYYVEVTVTKEFQAKTDAEAFAEEVLTSTKGADFTKNIRYYNPKKPSTGIYTFNTTVNNPVAERKDSNPRIGDKVRIIDENRAQYGEIGMVVERPNEPWISRFYGKGFWVKVENDDSPLHYSLDSIEVVEDDSVQKRITRMTQLGLLGEKA